MVEGGIACTYYCYGAGGGALAVEGGQVVRGAEGLEAFDYSGEGGCAVGFDVDPEIEGLAAGGVEYATMRGCEYLEQLGVDSFGSTFWSLRRRERRDFLSSRHRGLVECRGCRRCVLESGLMLRGQPAQYLSRKLG